jgi:N-acetylglutamate synthase-like GNAT family acetyltransferase
MIEVREYQEDDFEAVEGLLREFHEESLRAKGLKFEISAVRNTIKDCNNEKLVLVVDNKLVGIIAGREVEYSCQKQKLFQEMIWYVSKKHRAYGKNLLKALENKCRRNGLAAIIMVAFDNQFYDKLDSYYIRQKYIKLETHYIKVLV